jgi:hypothetical protein
MQYLTGKELLKGSATVALVYETEVDVALCSTLELLTSTIFRPENVQWK